MTNTKTIINEKQKGFTLFVALLVASAVILGSYAVSNALFFQLKQSSTNRESLKAQIVADNGVECAMYYDERGAFDPVDPDAEPAQDLAIINCADTSTDDGDTMISSNEIVNLNDGSGAENIFEVKYGVPDDSPCARVTVVKSTEGTEIKSRGYNKCDPNASRRVERAIIVNY